MREVRCEGSYGVGVKVFGIAVWAVCIVVWLPCEVITEWGDCSLQIS